MILIFVLSVTPLDPASAKNIARSSYNDPYFQKNIQKAEKLLAELDTLPTSEPPDVFDSIPSFITKAIPNNYPSPDEKFFVYSSSVKDLVPYEGFGSRLTFALTNLLTRTYTPSFVGKMSMTNWPLEDGKGTWRTWVTMFPTTTLSTKRTRKTLSPDPLTDFMTTRITTEETEYNPVQAWYDKQKSKSSPRLLNTHKSHKHLIGARRHVNSSDLETPVTTLGLGSTQKIEEDINTDIKEKPFKDST